MVLWTKIAQFGFFWQSKTHSAAVFYSKVYIKEPVLILALGHLAYMGWNHLHYWLLTDLQVSLVFSEHIVFWAVVGLFHEDLHPVNSLKSSSRYSVFGALIAVISMLSFVNEIGSCPSLGFTVHFKQNKAWYPYLLV